MKDKQEKMANNTGEDIFATLSKAVQLSSQLSFTVITTSMFTHCCSAAAATATTTGFC